MATTVNALTDDQLDRVTGGYVVPWGTHPSASDPKCAATIANAAAKGTVPGIWAGIAAGTVAGVTALAKLAPKVKSRVGAFAVGSAFFWPVAGGAGASMGAEYGIGSYVKHHDPACTG